jgi:hypothetical protein
VTREQFRNFVKALRSGDADAVAVLKATANEAWAEQSAED